MGRGGANCTREAGLAQLNSVLYRWNPTSFWRIECIYWCLKKEIPTSLEQIDSAFGFELPASATKVSFDDWYKNVSLTVENEELLVTRKLDKTSKKSTVNCESVSSTN